MMIPRRLWIPLLALALLAAAGVLWMTSVRSASPADPAAAAGLAYARQTMQWQEGPTLVSSHAVRLGHLGPVLRASAPQKVVSDVNVPDLIRRFGANRRVDLVVVAGTFNTLPPDEGVLVHADAVVIVDMKTRHALFLDT